MTFFPGPRRAREFVLFNRHSHLQVRPGILKTPEVSQVFQDMETQLLQVHLDILECLCEPVVV